MVNKIATKTNSIETEIVKDFFTVAELITHSDVNRRRKRSFSKSFLKNSSKMISSIANYKELIDQSNLTLGEVTIEQGDARKLNLRDSSVDGIITSPPYSIALDYVENDKHALSALGYDIKKVRDDFIGVRGKGTDKVSIYNQDMVEAYSEMDRVLKKDKFCTIVIGNARINKNEIKTVELTINAFEKMGYKLIRNIDKIIFGLYNVMQKENILIFKK